MGHSFKDNVAWATLFKDNVAWVTLFKDNVAWATLFKDNIAWVTLFVQMFGCHLRTLNRIYLSYEAYQWALSRAEPYPWV